MMRWVCIALVACGDPQGEATHSACPSVDPPSYTSFGQTFFQTYCLECHSQVNVGDARQGAPVTIDFDTRALVRESTSNIDKQAAWGPDAHNSLMPPDPSRAPTDAERVRLGEYIACEVASP